MIQEILQEKIIPRKIYLDKIFEYWNISLIKVIIGMRRAGKSSILKCIIQKIVNEYKIPIKNIFFIDKEKPDFDYITDYNELKKEFSKFLGTIDENKKIIIAIDEIQEIEKWEKFVNGFLSKYKEKIEIFITGSNSTMLSSELSTLLVGRHTEIEIFPLNLEEYATFTKKSINKELFEEYLKYGGLPGITYMGNNYELIKSHQQSIYSTILLKDIVKHFKVRNIDFFEDLYKYLFANVGNIVSSKSISDYLKSQKVNISPEVVLDYLNYGIKVYLLNKVKSVNPETKKFFSIFNKYYIGDIGLRNAIIGYDRKRDIGKLLENYVYLELRRNGYEVKIGRLGIDKEIDFVAEKYGILKYFQVCYLLGSEETIAKEYAPLEKIRDNWEKYVVSMDEINFGIHEGIKHINVLDLHKILKN